MKSRHELHELSRISTCMPPRRPERPSERVTKRGVKSADSTGDNGGNGEFMGKYSVFSIQCSVGLCDNRGVKRRVVRIVLTGVVVVAAVVLLWPRGEREPEYQGKKLSEWIGDEGNPRQADAVRHIGTNALPFLIGWIRYETPA